MKGIYTYIPKTNYVPREYSVVAILFLLFMLLISLVSVLNLFSVKCCLQYIKHHITSVISSFVQVLLCFTPVCTNVFWAWGL